MIPFGDAAHLGDLAATPLNGPVVGSVATPSGQGYLMVAGDGGVFAFGDATYAGSMGGQPLQQPMRGLVPTAGGGGYWLVAGDGGVFAFGDVPFRGSMGGRPLNRPVVGMVRVRGRLPDGGERRRHLQLLRPRVRGVSWVTTRRRRRSSGWPRRLTSLGTEPVS